MIYSSVATFWFSVDMYCLSTAKFMQKIIRCKLFFKENLAKHVQDNNVQVNNVEEKGVVHEENDWG